MSVLTTFFNLIKPAKTDGVKVSDFNANMDIIDTEMHKPPLTVNGVLPDETNRNIEIESVPIADNLSSDEAQFNQGTFLIRTSGGGTSVADGTASLSTIKGNMVKTGYVAEELNMVVDAAPREAPAAITATLDAAAFVAYVGSAGTYTLTYTTAWSADPTLYGITVTNTPVSGDSIVVYWDGETTPEMTVNAVVRPVPAPITATLNRDTFVAYVNNSGTITLTYGTAWSANPALYGVTVYNTPISGDKIILTYVKENRGTLTPVAVSVFNSTGWNLYDNSTGYARVCRYSDEYGYKIGGTYSLVKFATTPSGTQSAVTVENGYFNVPSDGYIIVTGGNNTTYIYPTWSDWVEGYEGNFEAYADDTVDLTEIMVNFGNGLLSVGDVRDEINFNTQKSISRIERLAYNATNLATAQSSGRPYDTDTNYIYLVRAQTVEVNFTVDPTYIVSDHGTEFFTASTTTPPVTEIIYGDNLKDKLRSDVLTISQQTLSSNQKNQVLANIGALGKSIPTYSGNLNNISETGMVYATSSASNVPEAWSVVCTYWYDANAAYQTSIGVQSRTMFSRTRNSNGWTAWEQLTNRCGEITPTASTSLLSVVNSLNKTALPYTFTKVTTTNMTDTPSILSGKEFTGIVIGYGTRVRVILQAYSGVNDIVAVRDVYSGSWSQGSWIITGNYQTFIADTYSYAYSTISSGSYKTISATNLGLTVPTGYTLLGIVGYSSGNNSVVVYKTNTDLDEIMRLKNPTTSGQSGTCSVRALFVRSDLL